MQINTQGTAEEQFPDTVGSAKEEPLQDIVEDVIDDLEGPELVQVEVQIVDTTSSDSDMSAYQNNTPETPNNTPETPNNTPETPNNTPEATLTETLSIEVILPVTTQPASQLAATQQSSPLPVPLHEP